MHELSVALIITDDKTKSQGAFIWKKWYVQIRKLKQQDCFRPAIVAKYFVRNQCYQHKTQKSFSSKTANFQKKNCFVCLNESTLKKLKNAFHVTLKAYISFSRYFTCIMVVQKKRLDQKDEVNFKIHDITT